MPVTPLVVVAHRLPIRRVGTHFEPSPGGVASALSCALQARPGSCWVGWDGAPGGLPRIAPHGPCRIVPVPLGAEDRRLHYEGFANGCLWPLYHGGLRPYGAGADAWERYVSVNARFARIAASCCRTGASCWVHDYQLQLVPARLRRWRPDLRIGFFLHVPFPEPERMLELTWHREILAGILGANLVGFQTRRDLERFRRTVELAGEAHPEDALTLRTAKQHRVRTGVFPISIDARRFARQAGRRTTTARARTLRAELGDRTVLLGVDRLDYTKGIDARLSAFERLLDRGALDPRRHVLFQQAVPSREGHPHYAELRRDIEQQVARIQRRHGNTVLRFVVGNAGFEELVALYRAADLMLVTSYADGMNLVAKEFVTSRLDDSGVLLLSRATGAAETLAEAVQVDPRDSAGLAEGLVRALSLPPAHARRRMAALRARVAEADVHAWADRFLDTLEHESPPRVLGVHEPGTEDRGFGPIPPAVAVGR